MPNQKIKIVERKFLAKIIIQTIESQYKVDIFFVCF